MNFLKQLFDFVKKPVFSDSQLAPWKRYWKIAHKYTGAIAISRSKYKTHQGPKECARRIQQGRAGK